MKLLFSVVLPTFNRAHLLTATINSIVNQKYSNWELIIIDDGSTDNTASVVKEFSLSDERIKYYYQDNAERSAARNNGILKSNGQFICFLDSDDAYDPEHLYLLQKEIEQNNNANNNIYVAHGKVIFENNQPSQEINLNKGKNDFETILLNSITPGQICVPKHLMTQTLFNVNIRISEDTELLFRLAQLAPLKILNQHTFLYYQHDDNSVNFKKYNAFAERKKTLEVILTYPSSQFVSSEVKNAILSNCYFGIVKFYVAQGQLMRARWNLFKAIFLYPTIRLKEKIYLFIYPIKAL